ncbi:MULTISPECIES: sulfate/molybdate ABC transporter ATP-binding protein [Bacillus]|uniref:sulfate/molybdate ABC transporter ATP-binding protein n=1 Tax=Bacillus TaxID=1386 RepID=UPI0005ADB4DC|nr:MULTISPECIES: sulfate ABC transporter ATP-binding protein [Bacillus]KIL19086.1 Sulfate and thiosulfate import ATP-binding protein CysA [Bacillus safensis]MBI1628464.1 sulfate ABC transporter ATP-binding protein [Bacillus safensis]MBL4986703.1 sulfate ABC transporter ATP-binding protein [Bacillus safensis]MCR6472644.1 sulfate ABC transporter ATP-binding protein [Bacillus safensis]MEC3736090.1 sulfate ABC transporter ATP-binding protein [Bacillus safensis]
MGITAKQISKQFGQTKVLQNVDLSIRNGELISLLGPSGSGKTTLLRIIAGLDYANNGQILFGDQDYTHIPVRKRQIGFVFQQYALFRNMTVFDNVAYGLKIKPRGERLPKKDIKERVHELLEVVQLTQYEQRYPDQLSGGQKQRVALARALAVQPKALLLDEPFGALDTKVRKELRHWLKKVHRDFQMTTIFVTHDQEEAFDIADRVVVMNEGRIEKIGTKEEMAVQTDNLFVSEFLDIGSHI